VGAAAALVLVGGIYFGSGRLQNFDSALIGYAVAVVFLAFGVAYRYTIWVQSPPARRFFLRGWRSFLSWRNFTRYKDSRSIGWLGWITRSGRPAARSAISGFGHQT
jgi:hypothetical protein